VIVAVIALPVAEVPRSTRADRCSTSPGGVSTPSAALATVWLTSTMTI
jgi:hypothetical protein